MATELRELLICNRCYMHHLRDDPTPGQCETRGCECWCREGRDFELSQDDWRLLLHCIHNAIWIGRNEQAMKRADGYILVLTSAQIDRESDEDWQHENDLDAQ